MNSKLSSDKMTLSIWRSVLEAENSAIERERKKVLWQPVAYLAIAEFCMTVHKNTRWLDSRDNRPGWI